jgi:two-component system, LuxR family, response regulator FixJ
VTKRRIYVVDDEEPIRRATRLMLSVQGYDVTSFDSGTALLEVAETLPAGAILLDIRMPGRDGIEVQQALNAAQAPHAVIVMTGHGDLSVALAALQGGAVAFLEKPFARKALDQALSRAFAKLEDPERFRAEQGRARDSVEGLAESDRRLLAGLASGESGSALADALGTTLQAVDARRARLFAELGVDGMAEALTLAFAAGLGPSYDARDPSLGRST